MQILKNIRILYTASFGGGEFRPEVNTKIS